MDRAMRASGGCAVGHVVDWVFDLDNTLYPASCNLFAQVDRRMGEFISRLLGVAVTEARRLQKQYFCQYGTTLRGLMIEHRVDPNAFLDYVHRIDVSPVPPSPPLEAALRRLEGRKIVFTNATRRHADNVLGRLGIGHHFHAIFDIVAAGYLPKPHPQTYAALLRQCAIVPGRAALIEDIARNLEPAAALGMTTVWVRSDSDWGRAGLEHGDGHIHHVADDLVAWLDGVAAARGGTARHRGGG
jgi:putative hydrolase of the HAD superfamily